MKYSLSPLAFGLGASAGLLRRNLDQCCFKLEAHGYAHGHIGQLSDGQCRIGGGHDHSTFCINKHSGTIKDSTGRECIVTEVGQFQCDSGSHGSPGFSFGGDNSVSYDGQNEFWACPVNDDGEWNVYTKPIAKQSKCVKITLSWSGHCRHHPAPAPPPPPPPPKHDKLTPKLTPHPPLPPPHPPKPTPDCHYYKECYEKPDCVMPSKVPHSCHHWSKTNAKSKSTPYLLHPEHPSTTVVPLQPMWPWFQRPKKNMAPVDCKEYVVCYESEECEMPKEIPKPCWKSHYHSPPPPPPPPKHDRPIPELTPHPPPPPPAPKHDKPTPELIPHPPPPKHDKPTLELTPHPPLPPPPKHDKPIPELISHLPPTPPKHDKPIL
ncbi:hypothetical protein K432DRAFT_447644, partial [Lepidopterella palustris CBS 459.81]